MLPSASQLSSISQRLCFLQKATTASRSKGFPRVCATITAFVFGDKASSSLVTSILYCGIVTSTNTGTAPYCIIGVTVVGKPHATVMTSSPLFTCLSPKSGDVKVINASKLALDPEFTSDTYFVPNCFPNSFSNSSKYLPAVSQNSKEASTRFTISSESYTLEAYVILSPSLNSFFIL